MGNLIAIGRCLDDNNSIEIEKYSTRLNIWQDAAKIPIQRKNFAVVQMNSETILFIGGSIGEEILSSVIFISLHIFLVLFKNKIMVFFPKG